MAKSKFLVVCGGSGEYLLGQREILGLQGELQIDVDKELQTTKTRLKGAIAGHYYSVQADVGAVNTYALFKKIPEIAAAQQWDETAEKHANFLKDNWIKSTGLKDGMAQSAAIGGLAILVKEAQNLLEKEIKALISNYQQGTDLEFWIISSLAGGTGEGIHLAVSEKIIELCQSLPAKDIKIKFIRIGYGTYGSCNTNRALNPTVLALSADAIFMNEIGKEYKEKAASISWYYLDFPDYGEGSENKSTRGSAIELGCKGLMLDQLTETLEKRDVNANTIICRVGYWGKEYDKDNLLSAALDGLEIKLNQFMNPDDKSLTPGGMEPFFNKGADLELACKKLSETEFLAEKIEQTWRLAGYNKPEKFEALGQYLDECEQSLEKLLGVFSYKSFTSNYKLFKMLDDTKIEVDFVSKSTAKNPGSLGWFDEVRTAQSVRAWAIKLLGIRWITPPPRTRSSWFIDSGLLDRLFKAHKECAAAFKGLIYKNSQVIASQLVKKLASFAELLIQVQLLYNQLSNSLGLLAESMAETQKMFEYTTQRKRSLPQRTGEVGAPIKVADLDDVLDQLDRATWLQLVYDKVTQKRPDEFDNDVRRGAIALTELGLKEVLNLSGNTNIKSIITELQDHVGRMVTIDKQESIIREGEWFGGSNPLQAPVSEFFYRMLPKLEGFTLGTTTIGRNIEIVCPPLGIVGLKVLALEGVTVAPKNDEVFSHAFLAMQYANELKQYIKTEKWDPPHVRGLDSPRMEIATGAVVGRPLSKEVLLEAGLTDEEINRLGEYLCMETFQLEPTNETKDK